MVVTSINLNQMKKTLIAIIIFFFIILNRRNKYCFSNLSNLSLPRLSAVTEEPDKNVSDRVGFQLLILQRDN